LVAVEPSEAVELMPVPGEPVVVEPVVLAEGFSERMDSGVNMALMVPPFYLGL
jgi:hypothetical protein